MYKGKNTSMEFPILVFFNLKQLPRSILDKHVEIQANTYITWELTKKYSIWKTFFILETFYNFIPFSLWFCVMTIGAFGVGRGRGNSFQVFWRNFVVTFDRSCFSNKMEVAKFRKIEDNFIEQELLYVNSPILTLLYVVVSVPFFYDPWIGSYMFCFDCIRELRGLLWLPPGDLVILGTSKFYVEFL